jgi:peptidoglycan-associated lipoprotein
MKKSQRMLAVLTAFLAGMASVGTSCAKKVTPPPAATAPATETAPTRPPAPAPTITLSASPTAIEQGQSSTLTWNSTNANEVTIDGGIGTVSPFGSRTVQPSSSTTYRARATGPGGTAEAETRITVAPAMIVTPPPARPVSDAVFFTERIKDIFFDYDKYDIRPDAREILLADGRAFAERPQLRFTIEGHCDERGSERYNLALGDRRANAAKAFLAEQGITGERIETVTFGKSQPFCLEHNEECWQQNRRAHFVLR